jgi:hypothetical protein
MSKQIEFWSFTEKGVPSLNNKLFKHFLSDNNFYKYKPTKDASSSFVIIQKNGIFLEIINEVDVKDFVLDYIENNNIEDRVFNLMSGNLKFFKREFLSMINSIDIEIFKDDRDTSYLFYKNCIVKTTKDKRELIQYNDVSISIWKDQIIKRDYTECDHHTSQYREFIWKISGEDVNRYNTFQSIIGYLIHSYKSKTDNFAIVLNDEMISDEPNGRSGKGLFWNALKNLKKVQSIDGKTFSFGKSFPYQSVSTDCQVLVFDDIIRNFPFEKLFSVITEGLTIEYKGKDAIHLPIEESPKILITTNYTVKGDSGSHEARKFEVELSTFFNANNTPKDYFKNELFNDWDSMEWARFDNYMIECVKKYLTSGLVKSAPKNLGIRKLKDKIGNELFSFVETIPKNDWISVKDIYDKFMLAYPELKKFGYTQNRLTIGLRAYLEFYKIPNEQRQSNGVLKFFITEKKQSTPPIEIWDELNKKAGL